MSSESKPITASLIFDIIGTPPEHLKETLNTIIDDMGKEKGVKILNRKINEPVLIKDRNDLYTTFAEIEIEAVEIFNIAILMFKYMPAHVEIISPESISLMNNQWTDILSEITRRLHGYEEIARIMQVEKGILEKKLREILNKDAKEETEKKDKQN